jgi:hypothetical protein
MNYPLYLLGSFTYRNVQVRAEKVPRVIVYSVYPKTAQEFTQTPRESDRGVKLTTRPQPLAKFKN